MKRLLICLILAVSASAQSVTVEVKLTDAAGVSKVYSVALPPAVASALAQFVADTKTETGAAKYANVADLLIRHVNESLAAPLLQRYPDAATRAANVAADAADVTAAKVAADAAAPVVTVK